MGIIYVLNSNTVVARCGNFDQATTAGENAILIFGPGTDGNVAPSAIIGGPSTGLNNPFGITIGPTGP
jgi:hypothetical protein